MRKTSAERYNDNMHRIFEEAKALNVKYKPEIAINLLKDVVEDAEDQEKPEITISTLNRIKGFLKSIE